MPPFLGQGANQAVQDAVCLARSLAGVGAEFGSQREALDAFEAARKPYTSQAMQTSRAIGWMDTQEGGGSCVRDLALFGAGVTGVGAKIFLEGWKVRV